MGSLWDNRVVASLPSTESLTSHTAAVVEWTTMAAVAAAIAAAATALAMAFALAALLRLR
jgi:hypothetical protein